MGSEMSERLPLGAQQGTMHIGNFHHDTHNGRSIFASMDAGVPPGGSQKRKRRIVRKNLASLFDAVQGVDEVENVMRSSSDNGTGRMGISQEVSEDGTIVTNNSAASEFDVWNVSQGSGDSSYSCGVTDEASGSRKVEKFDSVSLIDLLLQTDRGRNLSLMEVKALSYSIAKDLCEIHESGRVHTRVCLDSILLKIIHGTGRASLSSGQETAIVQTSDLKKRAAIEIPKNHVAYIAPESYHCSTERYSRSLTEKGNMWSFGCIVFALSSGGTLLFGDKGVGECGMDKLLLSSIDKQQTWMSWYIKNKIRDLTVEPNGTGEFACTGFDDDAMDLITKILHVDPAQRLSARAVLRHHWFDEVRDCIPQDDSEKRECDDVHHPREREPAHVENHEFSLLHNRYIYIDPSILSPMHPYALVGHIKREIRFDSGGETFKGVGVFAVYDVPDHGTMMSAKPIRISPF